ncbi:MAG TPA: DUF131 domain-containing protein [Methanomassiliicoccales archaeon]|nr:DUF131 domain-containing protein [Methanomassiliicoccales archaeon]
MMSRKLVRASGLILISLSVLLLIVAAIRGDLELILIFVIPVIRGEGLLPALGGILLFLGILLIFLSFLVGAYEVREESALGEPIEFSGVEHERRGRFGGLVLIGPLPIVFGSDRGIVLWMVVIAIVCLIAISLSIFLWSN